MKTATHSESKARNTSFWILQILVAAAFLASGVSKLTGQPAMIVVFDQIGIGQWFRIVTGGIEVVAAVLLLIPKLVPVGALVLAATMAGAVLAHLALIGGTPLPALILLILAAIIIWGRRNRLVALLGRAV
jgi:putative oxidoreductase